MGIWKQLLGLEEIPKGLPPITNAPPMPTIKEPKKDISEPVLSIIQTLKDSEWSFVGSSTFPKEIVSFTHEWFGHKLKVYCWSHRNTPECQSEWMTEDEKLAVGDVCWQIYQGRVTWEKEQSLAKQRESFMNLTGEY